MREKILYYAIHYNGNWHKIANAMHNQEPWKKLTYQGDYITYEDEMYPKQLKQLEQPPWILFYQGNIQLLEKKAVAIIGSRICDAYGQTRTSHIVSLLKEQAVIISGMAKGIDAIAHKTALSKQTIGVIGCGLDIIYPKENEYLYQRMAKQHLIISEYPNGTEPLSSHFPMRNRIIASLSQAIIVIQAKKYSGTMLTVNEALKLDIPIYCVPHKMGEIYGEGCNYLISQGANILLDDHDILSIL